MLSFLCVYTALVWEIHVSTPHIAVTRYFSSGELERQIYVNERWRNTVSAIHSLQIPLLFSYSFISYIHVIQLFYLIQVLICSLSLHIINHELKAANHVCRQTAAHAASHGGVTHSEEGTFRTLSHAQAHRHLQLCHCCLSVCISIRLSAFLPTCLYVHLSAYLCTHLSLYPSVCISVSTSVCLYLHPSFCISLSTSVCLSIHPSVCISVYLSVCTSVCIFVCLSVGLYVRLPAYLCTCLYVRLSVCLSVYILICLYVFLLCCLSICMFINFSMSVSFVTNCLDV